MIEQVGLITAWEMHAMLKLTKNPANEPFVIIIAAVSAAIFFGVLAALSQL